MRMYSKPENLQNTLQLLVSNVGVHCRSGGNELKTCMQMVIEAAKEDVTGHMDLEFLKVCLDWCILYTDM